MGEWHHVQRREENNFGGDKRIGRARAERDGRLAA